MTASAAVARPTEAGEGREGSGREEAGLAEVLAGNWQKAARFYANYGVTEGMFRQGLPPSGSLSSSVLLGEFDNLLRGKPESGSFV